MISSVIVVSVVTSCSYVKPDDLFKVTDDLVRQTWEAVKFFSWLFVVNQGPELAFRGKGWRRPAIYHGRVVAWLGR